MKRNNTFLLIMLTCISVAIGTQLSFNSGQLSPLMKYRVDLEKHEMGMEELENILVEPEGMAFKRPGTEFIDFAITEPNFTSVGEQVVGDYEQYFIGHYNSGSGGSNSKVVTHANTDSTIDTDWGDNGQWGFYDATTNNYATYANNLYLLEDGSLLVIHDNVWLEAGSYAAGGKLTCLAKLTPEGVLDTTFGYNGHYLLANGSSGINYPMANAYQLLECNDGTYILFGFGSGTDIYCLHKISADGDTLAVREYDKWPITETIPYIGNTYVVIWSDDNKTTLLVFSQANNRGLSGCWSNVVALNPDTFELDTSWIGACKQGTQYDGYGTFPSGVPLVYNVVKVSDGFIVTHGEANLDGSLKTVTKMKADWSDYDTTWGTNGHIKTNGIFGFNPPGVNQICVDADDNLYTITSDFSWNPDIQCVEKWDSTGTLVGSKTFDSNGTNYVYHTVQAIDDYLYFGTLDTGAVAYDDIEKWDRNFTYQSSFDIGLAVKKYVIIPDGFTREYTDTTVYSSYKSDKTRLIPFEHSTSDAYVLEFGHNYISFFRTE